MKLFRYIKFSSAGKLDTLKNKTIISQSSHGSICKLQFPYHCHPCQQPILSMRGDLSNLGAIVKVVSCDENVPKIECLQLICQKTGEIRKQNLPLMDVSPVFIVEFVYAQVFLQNMFALKGGIPQTKSPSKLVLNCKLDFNAHCTVALGE